MPIPLSKYAQVKNNYCIAYLGPCDEIVLQLKYLRPQLEQMLPGLNIYLMVKDKFGPGDRIILESEIEAKKDNFACIRNLKSNLQTHPVWDLLEEAGLTTVVKPAPQIDYTTLCILVTEGILPTKSISPEQIAKITRQITDRGFTVQLNHGSIEQAGWVVGVESELLFEAVLSGVKTTLLNTGVGASLYHALTNNHVPLQLEKLFS